MKEMGWPAVMSPRAFGLSSGGRASPIMVPSMGKVIAAATPPRAYATSIVAKLGARKQAMAEAA